MVLDKNRVHVKVFRSSTQDRITALILKFNIFHVVPLKQIFISIASTVLVLITIHPHTLRQLKMRRHQTNGQIYIK